MVKSLRWAMLLAVLCALVALPVLAAGPGDDGGVHFGNFTLSAGDTLSGDQMVMGAARLERESVLNGNLVVMGAFTLEEDALINGDVTVMGAADIAGKVGGDVTAAGPIYLRKTAHVTGDVSTPAALNREDGAVVEGTISSEAPSAFPWGPSWNWNGSRPDRPLWLSWLWKGVRMVMALLVFVLLALLVAAVWPQNLERMSETVSAWPLHSFGVGLLTLVATSLVSLVLLVTICLSPFALLALMLLALALALGWITLGHLLGRRLVEAVRPGMPVNLLLATVLGTALITFLAGLLNLVGFCLYAPVTYGLASLGLGALLLTRVGTRPYQSHGTMGYVPPMPMPPANVPPMDVPPANVPPVDVPPANPGA